jgi:hypothetical protein
MVITDFDTSYTSRENTGRFQATLAQRPSSTPTPSPINLRLSNQVELHNAHNRAQAIVASRRIDQTYRQH